MLRRAMCGARSQDLPYSTERSCSQEPVAPSGIWRGQVQDLSLPLAAAAPALPPNPPTPPCPALQTPLGWEQAIEAGEKLRQLMEADGGCWLFSSGTRFNSPVTMVLYYAAAIYAAFSSPACCAVKAQKTGGPQLFADKSTAAPSHSPLG